MEPPRPVVAPVYQPPLSLSSFVRKLSSSTNGGRDRARGVLVPITNSVFTMRCLVKSNVVFGTPICYLIRFVPGSVRLCRVSYPFWNMTPKSIGYARASTSWQTGGVKAQVLALKEAGCPVVFQEQVSTRVKKRTDRNSRIRCRRWRKETNWWSRSLIHLAEPRWRWFPISTLFRSSGFMSAPSTAWSQPKVLGSLPCPDRSAI